MRAEWLQKSGNTDEIIVVFGGWAVGPNCFGHLSGAQDVLFIDDFTDLTNLAALNDLGDYLHRRLVAWSFGVSAFGHWQAEHGDPFTRKTAIAGTLSPVDDTVGIPRTVVKATRDGLTQQSFKTFQRRCFGTAPKASTDLDIIARQAELTAVIQRGPAPQMRFDQIVIPTRDRIFPPANMERAWAGDTDQVIKLDAPHAPFALWNHWQDVP